MEKWTVAIGDPFNGLTLYGVFADYDEALTYAEDHGEDNEWWVVRIQTTEQ
jgi:hypothetical protein